MRRRKATLKALDVFPKVPEDYQKPTVRGGTLSILSLSVIALLVISEFFYYRATEMKYEYSVDIDMDSKLLISVDMTIAMPCEYLGADIIDLAGESKSIAQHMKMELSVFELTEDQMRFLKAKRQLLERYSESKTLNDFPVVERIVGLSMPEDQVDPSVKRDSCRIHGSIEVNKVAGNFHVTTGRSIPHPQGHAHLNTFIPKDVVNFSHRIDHLSFGPPVPGAVNPLDGSLKLAQERNHLFQYYIQVVPTKFSTLYRSMSTNQYSVTERNRTINHGRGSHGIAGVFFKYDMSPMMVEVKEERRPFWQFLVRLCGIVGGIFATSGMVHALAGSLTDGVLASFTNKKRLSEVTDRGGTQVDSTLTHMHNT